jgi:PKD repeat protein
MLTYSNYTTALATQLTGNSVFFDSPGAKFANGGNEVPLYAPPIWNQGSSYSHLAESFNSTSSALMTYSISIGETIYNPGPVTLCMFEDMGWAVNETCKIVAISGLTATNSSPTFPGIPIVLTAAVSNGSSVSYQWDFGDGNSDSGRVVSHQYASPGTYTAEVTATNSVNQETAVTTVQVYVVADRIYIPLLTKP